MVYDITRDGRTGMNEEGGKGRWGGALFHAECIKQYKRTCRACGSYSGERQNARQTDRRV